MKPRRGRAQVNDPAHRAKIDQLSLHPWVTGELAASTREMPETLEALRKFVASRRWKRAGAAPVWARG